jgi:ribulose-phosphate 3-epimerase
MVKISPSILAGDQTDLAATSRFAQESGANFIHIDVMDGKFVPPVHYDPQTVKDIVAAVTLPVEAHLMVVEPIDLVEEYVRAGAKYVAIHAEAQPPEELLDVITKIQKLGAKAGIAINPETKVKEVDEKAFALCDYVLVMSVNPGWAGQEFIHKTIEKVAQLEQLSGRNGWKMFIEVDGGINLETAQQCVNAGAKVLVMGSAFYKAADPKAALMQVKPLGED